MKLIRFLDYLSPYSQDGSLKDMYCRYFALLVTGLLFATLVVASLMLIECILWGEEE